MIFDRLEGPVVTDRNGDGQHLSARQKARLNHRGAESAGPNRTQRVDNQFTRPAKVHRIDSRLQSSAFVRLAPVWFWPLRN